jgi:hypothetical protein
LKTCRQHIEIIAEITKRAGDFSEFAENGRLIAVFFDFLKQPFSFWDRDDPSGAELVKKFVESSNRSTRFYSKIGDKVVALYTYSLMDSSESQALRAHILHLKTINLKSTAFSSGKMFSKSPFFLQTSGTGEFG